MTQAKDLFDKAVQLPTGHSVAVECPSQGQMNSLRTMLYRERTAFMYRVHPDFSIKVSSVQNQGKFYIVIKKEPPLLEPIILDEEGNIIAKIVSEDLAPTTPEPIEDTERIRSLMQEDGLSEEEIATYLGEDEVPDLSTEDENG